MGNHLPRYAIYSDPKQRRQTIRRLVTQLKNHKSQTPTKESHPKREKEREGVGGLWPQHQNQVRPKGGREREKKRGTEMDYLLL